MDTFRFLRKSLCSMLLLSAAAVTENASAEDIQWSFQNAVFANGSTLTGSFDFDADTDTISNVNALLSFGVASPNAISIVQGFGGASVFELTDAPLGIPPGLPGVNQVGLYLATPLSDAGGTVSLLTSSSAYNPYVQLYPYGMPQTYLVSGELVDGASAPVAVPEPEEVATLSAGLAALLLVLRRRSSSASGSVTA